MAYRKWKPSKAGAREFARQMDEIAAFCASHGITQSRAGDSYYFSINGKSYRVSNHTIKRSNAGAYDEITGEQRRELYHESGRGDDTIYIHAGKTRIVEIYNDLAAGHQLDGRGNRI